MSASIELDKLLVQFGDFTAVRQTDLNIGAGEFFSFLGPSGCGKTTILRTISGFQQPTSGNILIGGVNVNHLGPNKRPTALIFQNLALFPLMKVWENIAFALEIKGVSAKERRKRADELLELVALKNVAERQISELSGGQKQRVAVARALCAEPSVLLLDEPLSALDLKLRNHMRTELRAIQKRVGITFIYITHDQGEAMTMSDRVAVMSQGHIEQVAVPKMIYQEPSTAFVASFVGENNAIEAKVTKIQGNEISIATPYGEFIAMNNNNEIGQAVYGFARPEHVNLAKAGDKNSFEAEIEHVLFEGSEQKIHFTAHDGKKYKMSLTQNMNIDDFQMKSKIHIALPQDKIRVLPVAKLA